MSDIQVIDTEDGRLYQRTIWMKDEDYRRMSRLAARLDISKSEVIMAALKLYEDGLNAVEAEGFDVSCGRKPREIAKVEAEVAAINLGTVAPDADKPMSRDRIEEIFEGKNLYLD